MKRMNKCLIMVLFAALLLAPAGAQAGLNLRNFESLMRSYYICEPGDSGSNVSMAKERLQELGYYRAAATFDDDFNETMVQRVKLFQENNRLEVTGTIDIRTAETLARGDGSVVPGEYFEGYWSEPEMALIIPENTYGQWNEKSGNQFNFRIKVKNISQRRTVKAIEFYVYTEDIWGDELVSKSYPYRYTVETKFAPGVMGYTGYMTIPDRRETQRVHIAIHRVRYTDGTVVSVEMPEYYCWEIDW